MIEYMVVFVNDVSLDGFVLGYLSTIGKGGMIIFSAGVLPDVDMRAKWRERPTLLPGCA